MTRPSFSQIYMGLALAMSERSTCARTSSTGEPMRVGCAIVTPDFRKVLAVGYNGNASGLSNACDSNTPGACGCIHAECNAVINCDVPRATPKIVFATHLPCVACAKMLINLGGVQRVVYLNDYRIRTSLELFDAVGIPHMRFEKPTLHWEVEHGENCNCVFAGHASVADPRCVRNMIDAAARAEARRREAK